ncbi:TPA: hypothetical protein ACS7ZY_002722 [Providencia alcalifaciens]
MVEDKVIANVEPRALAALLNGGLSEAAYWIAQDKSETRLKQSIASVDILLNGLKKPAE